MKNIMMLVFVYCLVACGSSSGSPTRRPVAVPTSPPTRAWYDGGTLHDATAAQWNAANNANRLATASDWVTVITGWDTLEEAREKAEDLKTCVNESALVSPPEMKAPEIAAMCAILMGWEPKE